MCRKLYEHKIVIQLKLVCLVMFTVLKEGRKERKHRWSEEAADICFSTSACTFGGS